MVLNIIKTSPKKHTILPKQLYTDIDKQQSIYSLKLSQKGREGGKNNVKTQKATKTDESKETDVVEKTSELRYTGQCKVFPMQ